MDRGAGSLSSGDCVGSFRTNEDGAIRRWIDLLYWAGQGHILQTGADQHFINLSLASRLAGVSSVCLSAFCPTDILIWRGAAIAWVYVSNGCLYVWLMSIGHWGILSRLGVNHNARHAFQYALLDVLWKHARESIWPYDDNYTWWTHTGTCPGLVLAPCKFPFRGHFRYCCVSVLYTSHPSIHPFFPRGKFGS